MKSKFLFTTLPTNDLGLLTRSLPIGRELSLRGHEVVFSHPMPAPKKVIAEAGFENLVPIHPLYDLSAAELNARGLLSLLTSQETKKKYGGAGKYLWEMLKTIPLRSAPGSSDVWDMDHAFAIAGLLSHNFVQSQCQAYLDVIVTAGVDALVDFWNPFACIAARKTGIPLITINQGDALPNSKGFIWWQEKPADIPTVTPVLNRVLSDFGLKEIGKTEELNIGDLTLLVGMPETDPLTGEHDYKYIGAVLWQKEGIEAPHWFEDLPEDKPVVWLYPGNPSYGGMGKSMDSGPMLLACVEALASLDCCVVLSTGYHNLPRTLKALPSNFIHTPFVPGFLMAQRCDLMIHHGGYGSCQTGLVSGTPSLVLPTFSERESNARRIALLNAGEVVIPVINSRGQRVFDVDEIRQKTEKILYDPTYTENAIKWGNKLKSYGGAQKALDYIEAFMSGR